MTGLVYDVPEVKIEKIVPVSSSKLFLTWSVNSWNLPIKVTKFNILTINVTFNNQLKLNEHVYDFFHP